MGEPNNSDQWDANNEGDSPYPLLPPEDRLWLHPSEAHQVHELANKRRGWLNVNAWPLFNTPKASIALFLVASLAIGMMLATGTISVRKSPARASSNSKTISVILPKELSKKISTISNAVTQVKTRSGTLWQGAIFVMSSKFLVTSATELQQNETLFAKDAGGWKRLSVTALDPLTDSAILQMPAGRSNFVTSYSQDSPPVGALDEVVAPTEGSTHNHLVMAMVDQTSVPLSLTQTIYLANSIELSAQAGKVPLGSLVLDPEGDPIGIVVKTRSTVADGLKIWASPMPSITRVAAMISQHKQELHGYLGVEGTTSALPKGASYKSGVIVTAITANSPAENSGIRVGQYIVAAGSSPTPTLPILQTILETAVPGTSIDLTIWLAGKTSNVRATLTSHP